MITNCAVSLKRDRGTIAASISFVPVSIVNAYTEEEHERGKLGAKFVLYCLGRHSGASPIVSCILQRRSCTIENPRSGKLILASDSTGRSNFRHAGWLYHLPPRATRTSPVTVMIYRWIIVRARTVSPRGNTNSHREIRWCTWTIAESRSMSKVTQTASMSRTIFRTENFLARNTNRKYNALRLIVYFRRTLIHRNISRIFQYQSWLFDNNR